MMNNSSSSVAILLGTYNGAHFINQQLNSYKRQTYINWSLWASDDGSTDQGLDAIKDFSLSVPQSINLLEGPRQGVCRNFVSLINNENINASYYAFSDQDDIWINDKLERAVNWLDAVDPEVPALYCSRTELINTEGEKIGFSPDYAKPPSFANALLQNIASGNTMVFNNKARELLRQAADGEMVIHDWALYLVVTACGGHVFFDREPTVLYRQHDNNVIGNGMGLMTRMANFRKAHHGRKAAWNDTNIAMMGLIGAQMTVENQRRLNDFFAIRDSSLIQRLCLLRQSGVYHQQLAGTLTTVSYTLLNRM